MNNLKLRRIGDAMVVTIPTDVLDRYNLKEGDQLSLDSGPQGFTLSSLPADPAWDSAGRVMDRHREVLKRLAE